MKHDKPIRALGLYHDADGLWQRSLVTSDGRDIQDVLTLEPSESPDFEDCELIGLLECPDVELPVDARSYAQQSGVTTVSDLRQSDRSLGGRGAPLSPVYLHALARSRGKTGATAFLSLAERASIVWVNPANADPISENAVLAFDVGPALGPFQLLHDQRPDGNFAGGSVVDGALELFLDDSYFRRVPPKWMDGHDFAQLLSLVYELGDADAETTLCGMAATALILATEHFPAPAQEIVAYGAGTSHSLLMRLIGAGLSRPVTPAAEWELEAESLGAQTAAFLAVRAVKGLPTTGPSTTGVHASVGGATISKP